MRLSVLIVALALLLPVNTYAQETKPTAKVEAKVKSDVKAPVKVEVKGAATVVKSTPSSQPSAVAPVDPGVKQPATATEAVDASKDFVGALKAHKWWMAAAVGIFILMFVGGVAGLWTKIGTGWAWLAVGVLSLVAGCFAAFDSKGFNWSAFLGYITAGPTIAWLRDWIRSLIDKFRSAGVKEET